MTFAKTLSRDEMKNIKAGYQAEECNVCCYAHDVANGDYSNCSGEVEGPSGGCQGGSIKTPCILTY